MPMLVRVASVVPRSWIRAVSGARWRWPWLAGPYNWLADRFRGVDGVIQRGVGRGLRFNTGPSNAGYLLGTSEPAIQAVLARYLRPGMTVWDGGANVGFLTILAARLVGPSGRVLAFEPLPANAERIEHNARLNGFSHVVVRREALGGADGEARFLVAPDPTMGMLTTSGFLKPDQAKAGEIPVAVRALDSLAAEGLPRPDVLKLDVEGVEGAALAGGAGLLRDARPLLLVELHGTRDAVSAALDDLGYHAAVVGSSRPIAEAAWNAYVIAVPAERADLAGDVDDFCAATHEER